MLFGVKAVVVGARRTRQGTGPFVVRALRAARVDVTGVVASSPESAAAAEREHGAAGYDDVRAALAAETPDLVVVCSPYRFHLDHVGAAADAGCHCLGEKPLFWQPGAGDLRTVALELADRFDDRLLDVLTQWPTVLPAFLKLYPQAALPPATFAMKLGPITQGAAAVLDAAPHPLSLLWVLCGPGWIENVQVDRGGAPDLDLRFDYHFSAGTTRSRLTLVHSPEPPRPAQLVIDGLLARRRVELPAYHQFLVADDGREIALPDPLSLVVAAFVRRAQMGARTDRARLAAGQTHLETLVGACGTVG